MSAGFDPAAAMAALTENEQDAPSLNSEFDNTPIAVDFTGMETAPRLWPAGKYLVKVTKVERKIGKESGNAYANLELLCIAGPYKGKKIFDMVMLQAKPEDTEKKALIKLSQFLAATGQLTGSKTTVVLANWQNKVAWANVIERVEEFQGEKIPRNRIGFKGYEAANKYPLPDDPDAPHVAADPNDKFADENAPVERPATVWENEPRKLAVATAGAEVAPASFS